MTRGHVSRLAVLLVAVGALAVAGCATTSGEEGISPSGGAGGTLGEGSSMQNGSSIQGSAQPEQVPELKTIYFDFDKSNIRSDARPVLQEDAKQIQSHPEWKTISVEGNTDERGSEEYNLALGERRANAAKKYLVDLGVPASRLVTVSFGESMPAVQGHDEAAWKWNRRVDFRVAH